MDKYNLRSLGKKSLPGERQGTPGASAGRDNIRNTGGRSLNRRVPVNSSAEMRKTAKAENREIDNNQEKQVDTAEGASQNYLGTTKAGKPRQRRKWTDEINQFLLRFYLKITRLETDMTGYRHKLHQQFMNEYPEQQNITQQKLADQIRTIYRNNLIPQTVINRITNEIRAEQENNEVSSSKEQERVERIEDREEQNQERLLLRDTHVFYFVLTVH
jgi:hypothetical protein